ncbi:MAG TPA: DUF58 domain-containing protein [Sedimenticola thiotaurini]|uniref:DUF58 domain-containing protein n=1 Tax=Sedimenticola thiotaurini TaxID=1543721 RepID=A0A831W9G7_9GAMM|nr:DUF58 domain-containing protein [Sedimenticola thiotaurini]
MNLNPQIFRRQTRGLARDPQQPVHPGAQVTLDELIALRLQAGSLALKSHGTAVNLLAGAHRSRFRGRGMDYAESRAYQAGDDIRNMDWRITARTGQPHTKLYQEERERPVVVMLDLNPTMFFGTRVAFKSVAAARAAALIGWAAVAGGDRIGALLFNGGHHELQPRGGRRGALRLMRALVQATDPARGLAEPPHADGLNQALARLRRVARPGSLVFIFSDFYGIDDETGPHLMRLQHHNDLVAVQVRDALELAPPPPGRYGITDGRERGVLDTRSPRQRAHYGEWFRQRRRLLTETMQGHAIPLLTLATDDDPLAILNSGLHSRQRSRRNGRAVA